MEEHQLFDWLISLRFLPEDAQGYTAALVSLGFDDLQSLREVMFEANFYVMLVAVGRCMNA